MKEKKKVIFLVIFYHKIKREGEFLLEKVKILYWNDSLKIKRGKEKKKKRKMEFNELKIN